MLEQINLIIIIIIIIIMIIIMITGYAYIVFCT